jgi:site-specific recombinase XerD
MDTLTQPTTKAPWIADFTEWLASGGRSEQTISNYVQDIHQFATWFFDINRELFHPSLITAVDLRAYRQFALQEKRIKPSSWNRWHASLKALSTWAQQEAFVVYDPFKGIHQAAQEELPPRWLDEKDYRALARVLERSVNAANTERRRALAVRDRAAVYLMLHAGLRVGEVAGLAIDDLKLTERKGKVIVRLGKGMKRREIPLGNEVRLAVVDWLALRGNGSGPAFISDDGGPVTTRTLQRIVKYFGAQCGLELSPHDLRHTFAKRMLNNGVQLTVVSKLLGHSKLETTARYVQPGWGDFEEAVEGL